MREVVRKIAQGLVLSTLLQIFCVQGEILLSRSFFNSVASSALVARLGCDVVGGCGGGLQREIRG